MICEQRFIFDQFLGKSGRRSNKFDQLAGAASPILTTAEAASSRCPRPQLGRALSRLASDSFSARTLFTPVCVERCDYVKVDAALLKQQNTSTRNSRIYFSTVHISLSDDIISLLFGDIKGLFCANQTRNILQTTRGDVHHAVIFRAQKKEGKTEPSRTPQQMSRPRPSLDRSVQPFYVLFYEK